MNNAQDKTCCCITSQAAAATTIDQLNQPGRSPPIKYVAGVAVLIAAWWLIYSNLEPFAGLFNRMLSRWIGFSVDGHLYRCCGRGHPAGGLYL